MALSAILDKQSLKYVSWKFNGQDCSTPTGGPTVHYLKRYYFKQFLNHFAGIDSDHRSKVW